MDRPDKKNYRYNEMCPFGTNGYQEDLEMYIDSLEEKLLLHNVSVQLPLCEKCNRPQIDIFDRCHCQE